MEKVTQTTKPVTTIPPMDNPVPASTNNPATKRKMNINPKAMMALIAFVVIILGVGTGKILASTTGSGQESAATAPETKKSNNEAGIDNVDESQLQSVAGMLKEGGIEGEGTHHVERPGGPTQTVYVASSVLNLQDFVGKEVEVWGQTISGKKAGWLMDVVKVKTAN